MGWKRKIALMACVGVAISALVPAAAWGLAAGDTGGGGVSGGGSGGGSAAAYNVFSANYDRMTHWTRGGGSPFPATQAATSVLSPTPAPAALQPWVIRGDGWTGITDHWNLYVSYPTASDLAGNGATAGLWKWANVPGVTASRRPAISGYGPSTNYRWEWKWHWYWAAYPEQGLLGAPRAVKADYGWSNVASDIGHFHNSSTAGPLWLNWQGVRMGPSTGEAGRLHYFIDPDAYISVAGHNGTGGVPAIAFNMGSLTNRLDMPEGRYAAYLYRLGNREELQGSILATEEVLRPRVRVRVVDEAGEPVPGATATLQARWSRNNVPLRYGGGVVSFTTPAFDAGLTPRTVGEDSNHRSYFAGTTYDGDAAMNALMSDIGPRYNWAGGVGQSVAQYGYYLNVSVPDGYAFEGLDGDLRIYNSRYANDAGTAERGRVEVLWPQPGSSRTTIESEGRVVRLLGSRTADGNYGGFNLVSGIYEYVLTVRRDTPSGSVTIVPYFDADGDHVRDAGERPLDTALDVWDGTKLAGVGPLDDPDLISSYASTPPYAGARTYPAGTHSITLDMGGGDDTYRFSYVTGGVPGTQKVLTGPAGTVCDTTGILSDDTWNASDPHYGRYVSFQVDVAEGTSQTVYVGITAYSPAPDPSVEIPIITGPTTWLDSRKPADIGGTVPVYFDPSGSWKREPWMGIVCFPEDEDWAASQEDYPEGPAVAYLEEERRRDAAGSINLGMPNQSWTAPNADRVGGFPTGYAFANPAVSMETTWAAEAAALSNAPQCDPTGGTPFSGWQDDYDRGVNYYAAILWKVTEYRTVFDASGTPSTTERAYYQWAEPAVKNVKVYTSTGSM